MLPDESDRNKKREEYAHSYPDMAHFTVGKSILGREIDCYRIGEGRRYLLIVGAHHALEYITAITLYGFIEFLAEKTTRPTTYCGISLDFLLKKYSYFVIPALNVDGIELHLHGCSDSPLCKRQLAMSGGDFSLWQANARGVDLNHNYGYGFSEYKRLEGEQGIEAGNTRYSGEYPESEPETRALTNFLRALAPCAVLSLHTQGEEIYYHPANARTERVAARLARSVGYKTAKCEGLCAYGGLCDFTGETMGIPSFTVELGRGKNPLDLSWQTNLLGVVKRLLITLPKAL